MPAWKLFQRRDKEEKFRSGRRSSCKKENRLSTRMFTNETAAMYAHLKKFGGTDKFSDAEKFALAMVEKSKRDEYAAYQAPEVKATGIRYPF